ncbi:MAG TPA: S8 family serine peptidase [Burkholderiaceae bacterium]|nr:S8 family serine peptidase [Burkholderiaceae bacterium]
MSIRLVAAAVWAAAHTCTLAAPAAADPSAGAPAPQAVTDRYIVHWRAEPVRGARARPASAAREAQASLARRAGVGLRWSHTTARGASIYVADQALPMSQARALAARLANDPAVAWAEPDVRMHVLQVAEPMPEDGAAWGSWSMRGDTVGGARLFRAWALTGAQTVRVGVLDTGSRPHPDLQGVELPGHDFVSSPEMEGDGTGGRDADPTDPGDHCEAQGTRSSWHGLHVAGVIGALANNGIGIAGGAFPVVRLQHARVLGECGGWMSDIADAIDWVAGGGPDGTAPNPTPVHVINLSLGTDPGVACGPTMQAAVDRATARGVVVVAAAGNEAARALPSPANCRGVMAVGAHTASGDLAAYANRVPGVTLTAPGGGPCALQVEGCDERGILALGNSGTAGPGAPVYDSQFTGTSAATPHVAAAAALIRATHPGLAPHQVRSLLVSSTRPHPVGTWCADHAGDCGAGMLDAEAALRRAGRAPTISVDTPAAPVPGQAAVALSAGATEGVQPYTYHWTQVRGPAVALQGETQARATFTAPALRSEPLVFRVTVTSATGQVSEDQVVVQVDNPPVVKAPALAPAVPGTTWRVRLAASDPDGDPVVLMLVQAPADARLEGEEVVWPVPATAGRYAFGIAAADDLVTGSVLRFEVQVGGGMEAGSAPSGEDGGTAREGEGGGGGAPSWPALLALAGAAALARRLRPA